MTFSIAFGNVPSGRERWESENVAIPVKDLGVFLVEATDGKLRAYTIVIVSQMAIITKTVAWSARHRRFLERQATRFKADPGTAYICLIETG